MLKSFVAILALSLSVNTAQAQLAKSGSTSSMKVALKSMLQEEGAAGLKKLTVAVSGEQASGFRSTYGVEMEGNYVVYNGTTSDGGVMGTVINTFYKFLVRKILRHGMDMIW